MKDPEKYLKEFMGKDHLGSLFSYEPVKLTHDIFVATYTAQKAHYNPNGTLHGGAIFTVMDSCQGLFVTYRLDESYKCGVSGTGEIKWLKPLFEGDRVEITTKVVNSEGRKLFVETVSKNMDTNEIVATLNEIWILIKND